MVSDPIDHVYERAEREHRPLTVVVELTHACNVDCEHCYLDLVPDSKIGAMSTAEWKRVLGEIKASGGLFLTMTGGEVLVRKDFFELAEHARSLGFALTIFTNGTLIDEAKAERIAALRPFSVESACSAASPRRTTRSPAVAARSTRRSPQSATCARAKSTCSSSASSVGRTSPSARRSPRSPRRSAARCTSTSRSRRRTTARSARSRSSPTTPPSSRRCANRRRVNPQVRRGRAPVSRGAPRLRSVRGRPPHLPIGPTGDVFPCTQWKTGAIGNVRETPFATIWTTNETLARVRKTRVRDFPICNECALLEVCGPCMALGLLEVGAIGGPTRRKRGSAEVRARAQRILPVIALIREARRRGEKERTRAKLERSAPRTGCLRIITAA